MINAEKILPLSVDHFNQNGNVKNISHIDASNNEISTNETETDKTTPATTTIAVDCVTTKQKKNLPKVSSENFELEVTKNKSADKKGSGTAVPLTSDVREYKQKQELTMSSIGIPIGGGGGNADDGDNKNGKNNENGNDNVSDNASEDYQLFQYPWEKSCIRQIMWAIIWPIHLLFALTIPDCEQKKFKNLFPVTFLMCIVWIGSLSYLVAWMITIVGM